MYIRVIFDMFKVSLIIIRCIFDMETWQTKRSEFWASFFLLTLGNVGVGRDIQLDNNDNSSKNIVNPIKSYKDNAVA